MTRVRRGKKRSLGTTRGGTLFKIRFGWKLSIVSSTMFVWIEEIDPAKVLRPNGAVDEVSRNVVENFGAKSEFHLPRATLESGKLEGRMVTLQGPCQILCGEKTKMLTNRQQLSFSV